MRTRIKIKRINILLHKCIKVKVIVEKSPKLNNQRLLRLIKFYDADETKYMCFDLYAVEKKVSKNIYLKRGIEIHRRFVEIYFARALIFKINQLPYSSYCLQNLYPRLIDAPLSYLYR